MTAERLSDRYHEHEYLVPVRFKMNHPSPRLGPALRLPAISRQADGGRYGRCSRRNQFNQLVRTLMEHKSSPFTVTVNTGL